MTTDQAQHATPNPSENLHITVIYMKEEVAARKEFIFNATPYNSWWVMQYDLLRELNGQIGLSNILTLKYAAKGEDSLSVFTNEDTGIHNWYFLTKQLTSKEQKDSVAAYVKQFGIPDCTFSDLCNCYVGYIETAENSETYTARAFQRHINELPPWMVIDRDKSFAEFKEYTQYITVPDNNNYSFLFEMGTLNREGE